MNTDAQSILAVLINATPNRQIGSSVVRNPTMILSFVSLNYRRLSLLIVITFVE